MIYRQTLRVPRARLEELERLCSEPDGDIRRDSTVFDEEVVFENGNRMAIQVCASTQPAEEECWTQGVVFGRHGNELGCTDCGEAFAGEYHVWVGDDEYITEVVAQEHADAS